MEYVEFFFDNIWHFCGLVIVISLLMSIIAIPFNGHK